MRAAWIVAAAVALGGAAVQSARGGVYNTSEPWPQPRPFKDFQFEWAAYRAAALPTAGQASQDLLGLRYRRQVAELEDRERKGLLSQQDRINLGAYYLRLQEHQKAIRLLEPSARQTHHFMLLANLASAYEQAGMLERAVDYRGLALSAWPTMYPGWDTFQVNFYRKAEKYQLTLAQRRLEQARTLPPAEQGELRLDDLFPRVRFVGPGGKYQVGGIAPAQWGELPNDATAVVQQLVLWSPFDDRLLWLLGELLNANGEVAGSAQILKSLVERQAGPSKPGASGVPWSSPAPPELREHYRAIAAEAAARDLLSAELVKLNDPLLNLKLLCAFAPHGMGLGAGDLMQEATWPAIAISMGGPGDPRRLAPGGDASAKSVPPSYQDTKVDWKQVGIGFAAGAVVALLLGMQIRQLGRRRSEGSRMEHDATGPVRPLTIGWKEYLAFPAWGIRKVRAKVDTGARTSALDAASYDLYHADGGLFIRLRLALRHRGEARLRLIEAPVLRMVVVRNSNGMCEQRPLIETEIALGPVTKRIQLTVTNRAGMRYRVILGRQALAEDFVVDVGRKYLLGR